MTELTRKRLFPRLFASNETKVGNAASGCCVSKYDLEVCELVLSLCLSPLHRLPLTSLFITFLISLLLSSSARSFSPFEELMAGSWVVIQSQTGCSNHRLLIGFIILTRDLRWEKNQLVKKRCAAIKLHVGTLTHAQTHGNTHTHTYGRTPSFLVQILSACGGIAKI